MQRESDTEIAKERKILQETDHIMKGKSAES